MLGANSAMLFLAAWHLRLSDVRTLKQHLEPLCGVPRFRQRLIHEDGTSLDESLGCCKETSIKLQ